LRVSPLVRPARAEDDAAIAAIVRTVMPEFGAENDLVTSWQVIGGLRFDLFVWDVDDLNPSTELTPSTIGGIAQLAVLSPKLSLVFRPAAKLDVFVNGGLGFHSNDARAATSSAGARAIARAYGTEAGARIRPLPGLSASVAAWYLFLTSEQVWNGDEGGTEASLASRRLGLDLDVAWDVTPWLALDANVALAHPTLVLNAGNGGALALAPKLMGGGGAALHKGPNLLSVRARGLGARPANDDGSLTAGGYLILDLVASHKMGPWDFGLMVNNLLNTEWREAQFGTAGRSSWHAARQRFAAGERAHTSTATVTSRPAGRRERSAPKVEARPARRRGQRRPARRGARPASSAR
jgi:hypothetical protein